MTEERVVEYEVGFTDGRRIRFEVPASFKVTFGPLAVGGKGYTGSDVVLRVYEDASKERQRMLLTGVRDFRDLSLPLKVAAVRLFGSQDWYRDNGLWVGGAAERVDKAWKTDDELTVGELVPEENVEPVPFDDTPAKWKPLRGMESRRDRAFTVEK